MRRKFTFLILFAAILGVTATATADLVAHWTFDDGSGDTVSDMSGNGADGTFTGNPDWAVGPIGGALRHAG
jgi:hypothetical protein